MKIATNLGIWTHNAAPAPAELTVAVTGLGRSGTTMVARVLTALGLFMGEHLSPQSHECEDFRRVLNDRDIQGLIELSRNRDAMHARWGFKVPAFRQQMNSLLPHLRNPRVIVPVRDVMAISMRRNMVRGMETLDAVDKTLVAYAKLMKNVRQCTAPVLMFSYEKALQFPIEVTREIAAFCDCSQDPALIELAAQEIRNGDPRYLGSASN